MGGATISSVAVGLADCRRVDPKNGVGIDQIA
jgi:hypothetical protein